MSAITPKNYNLEFEPNFSDFTFRGSEIIAVLIPKKTNIIVLHAAEIEIKNCTIQFKQEQIQATINLDKKNETLSIKIPKKVNGLVNIHINFSGILNDRLLGFYKSEYTDNEGKTKYLATTQFEAADARRAFPCWDEPQAKATFDIKLIVDKNLMAISNMPVVSKIKLGKKIRYSFSQTPIMSTYLLYLGVGEFEFLEGRTGRTNIRVYTTKGNKSKAKFSLDLTKKFLKSYENYFGIKYPLPKLDMLAIPDFAAGAMENWGAITFRETILLYDQKTSSTKTKQYIAEVVSHEIAHQWFGNLVTMKWWDDLWLNESFATFMATKIVNEFYPEWVLWDQFLEGPMNTAMEIDSLKSSHPIHVKVRHPSEIREIFDSISYDKGGCILRMLESYVGENNFRNGLKHYLTKHKYKNATTEDLWDSLGFVAKKPVRSVMNTWIKQMGFPLVESTLKDSGLVLTQKRFLGEPAKKQQKQTWAIPISIKSGKKIIKKLLNKKTNTVSIGKKNSNFFINSGREGFYRVKYSSSQLEQIGPLIQQKILQHVDRWAVQNDLFALCYAGQGTVKNYLEFSLFYYDEYDYLTLLNLLNNLYYLAFLSFHEKFPKEIRNTAYYFFKKTFEGLGWDKKKNEKPNDALLRAYVISILAKLDDNEIIKEAQKRFGKFLKDETSLDADLRASIYDVIAWSGNEKTHDTLTKLYLRAKTQEEKLRFLGALCNFRQKKLILKTLQFSLTKDVRSQNMQLPILRVAGNPYARKMMWGWLGKNWKPLLDKIGIGNPLANRIVGSIRLFADDTMESEIRKFFKKNPVLGTERTLEQSLEKIRIQSKFLKSMKKEFPMGDN